jgi:hypothetical protein
MILNEEQQKEIEAYELEMNPQAANARKALMARLYQEEDKAKPASLTQTMQRRRFL